MPSQCRDSFVVDLKRAQTFSNVSVTENALRQRQKMFIEDVRRSVNVGSLYGKRPGSETVKIKGEKYILK